MEGLKQIIAYIVGLFTKKKTPDYTVLTKVERDSIRQQLTEILSIIMSKKTPRVKKADEFMKIQANCGEKFNTFDEKMNYLVDVLQNLYIHVK